jgi:hypothetical protein
MTANLAVDTDAQLRTLAALAPVGRRSLLRYAAGHLSSVSSGTAVVPCTQLLMRSAFAAVS